MNIKPIRSQADLTAALARIADSLRESACGCSLVSRQRIDVSVETAIYIGEETG